MTEIRYCQLINDAENGSNWGLVGMLQWAKAFRGKRLVREEALHHFKRAPQLEEFDLIHIPFTKDLLGMAAEIKKSLPDHSRVKIVLSVDIHPSNWEKSGLSNDSFCREAAAADLITATEYPMASILEKISGQKVFELPHPADLIAIKSLPRSAPKKLVSVFFDSLADALRDDTAKELQRLKWVCRLFQTGLRLVIRDEGRGTYLAPEIRRLENLGFELVFYDNEPELVKLLTESALIRIPGGTGNYQEILICAAATGSLVLGDLSHDAARRCYPFTTNHHYSFLSYEMYTSGAVHAGAFFDFITRSAIDRVEHYNRENMKDRLLGLLDAEIGDVRYSSLRLEGGHHPELMVFAREFIRRVGPSAVECRANQFVVVCLVKNGMEYLAEFLDYYRRMGTAHFYFIDNGSTDNTPEILAQQTDITLFKTALEFKRFESEIRRYIIEKYCRGKWCLCVDIDEFFDYPHSDQISMSGLLDYFNEHQYTAMVTYMLDMFSREVTFEKPMNSGENRGMIARNYSYYDLSRIRKSGYFSHGVTFCNYNQLSNPNIQCYFGGVRRRYFSAPGVNYLLLKHALFRMDGKLEPVTDPHYCNKASVADISGVLKHYKLTTSFKERVQKNLNAGNYPFFAENEYKAYYKTVKDKGQLKIGSFRSQKLKHVNQLIHRKFIHISEQYCRYILKKTDRLR